MFLLSGGCGPAVRAKHSRQQNGAGFLAQFLPQFVPLLPALLLPLIRERNFLYDNHLRPVRILGQFAF